MKFSWLSSLDGTCGDSLHLQASTYIIPLLCLSLLRPRLAGLAQPLSAAVACVGTVGILRDLSGPSSCNAWLGTLGIALHVIPAALVTRRADGWRNRSSAFVSGASLLLVMASYIAADIWPYSITPASVVLLGGVSYGLALAAPPMP